MTDSKITEQLRAAIADADPSCKQHDEDALQEIETNFRVTIPEPWRTFVTRYGTVTQTTVERLAPSLLKRGANAGFVAGLIPKEADAALEFIKLGADPNEPDGFGWTPLCKAAESGKIELVKALLAVGADPSTKSQKKDALGWAKEQEYYDCAALIEKALSK